MSGFRLFKSAHNRKNPISIYGIRSKMLLEPGELPPQVFENCIDTWRKYPIVSRFKLRDLRLQPFDANLDGC